METVPFNQPYLVGSELGYVENAVANAHLSGNGPFSRRCSEAIERVMGRSRALLTHSGTGALEMAAALARIKPGDEVIMPSYTFVSTANAFALRGGVPVFVDIREDTLNIDERLVEDAVTQRTKAIVAVHYGGVAAEMDALSEIANRHGLMLIEDAAQGFLSTYRGRPAGALAPLAALSFHETKNVSSGEGGAIIVNDVTLVEAAEIIHEKGTNRAKFFRGEIDKYTWVEVGSSFLLSDLAAAFLWGQIERAQEITAERRAVWQSYHAAFAALEARGLLRRPIVPDDREHNGHLYYLLVQSMDRDEFIASLKARGVHSVFHYVPLHSSPAGRRVARTNGDLPVTQRTFETLVRLPLWMGMRESHVAQVIAAVEDGLR